MEESKEKQCDCGCHTSQSSSEEMRKSGCDLCYSGSEYYPRHEEQPKEISWEEEFNKKFSNIHNVRDWRYETCDCAEENFETCSNNVKQFIQKTIYKQKEEIKKFIDENSEYMGGLDYIETNNIISFLDSL